MITKSRKKIEITDVIIFLLPIILFGLCLFIYYPGILSYDSYNQLYQIDTGVYYNWHPFIHTFIEKMCLYVWNSPASIGIFQIIIFSIIWTSICKYNRNNSKACKIIQIVVTLLICINPINSIYSITLWKDIIFSYLMLLLMFLFQIIFEKKFKVPLLLLILISFVLSLISSIRDNGIFIVIIVIFILAFVFFKKDKYSYNFLKLPLFTVIFYILIMTLGQFYNVIDNKKDALEAKSMNLMAYYIKYDKVADTDLKIINKVTDSTKISDIYTPYFVDNIYSEIDHEKFAKNKSKIIKMSIKYSTENKKMFVNYLIKSSSMCWRLYPAHNSIGGVFYTNIENTNNYRNIKHVNLNKGFYQKIDLAINKSITNKILYVLLYSPAFYMYLCIIIFCILNNKIERFKSIFMIFPNIINVFIVAISTPLQDIRYIYPNFLVMYLILIVAINYFTSDKNKLKRLGK